ncbi:MAG: threonine/serine exporter family protein, partial [Actinomycetota bacterium]
PTTGKSDSVCQTSAGLIFEGMAGTGQLRADKTFPSLEPTAMVALDAGRLLMESGASTRNVEKVMGMVARGLGAERVHLRAGYASLSITIGIGSSGITRMRNVGMLGVNQQLALRVWELARHVARGQFTTDQTRAELIRVARETPRHPRWVTAVAVGLACAAFGRLLAVDWLGAGAVLGASMIAQYLRSRLLSRGVNAYICTMLISFLGSVLAGFGARWAGSETLAAAMIASILLLVPGVPAVNAQNDVLEGRPTLGSARVVTVIMTLVFIAAGLWCARVVVRPYQ